jgi:hypothetical protein
MCTDNEKKKKEKKRKPSMKMQHAMHGKNQPNVPISQMHHRIQKHKELFFSKGQALANPSTVSIWTGAVIRSSVTSALEALHHRSPVPIGHVGEHPSL